MQKAFSSHSPRLKQFFRHVCISSKEHEERDNARKDLDTHVKKLKKISLGKKTKKEEAEREFGKLNEKIDLVLNREGKLLKYIRVDENTVRQLLEKNKNLQEELSAVRRERDQARMEKEGEIKRLTDAITEIRLKIHQILKEKMYRKERMKELEAKIKSSAIKHPSP